MNCVSSTHPGTEINVTPDREAPTIPKATISQKGLCGRRSNQSRTRRDYLLGGDSKSGDSDSAVPLLRFGARNNWLRFKEKLSIACTEKFGDLGRLIETGEYWVPPAIRSDDFPDWEDNKIHDACKILKLFNSR